MIKKVIEIYLIFNFCIPFAEIKYSQPALIVQGEGG